MSAAAEVAEIGLKMAENVETGLVFFRYFARNLTGGME
jgi:hypothetical protein